MTRFIHTPRWSSRARRRSVLAICLGTLGPLAATPAGAQAPASPLLDALSISVQFDSVTVARGTMRFRQVRSGTDLALVTTGIVVRRGLRVTAELLTDSTLGLRRYVAESRDSAGRLIDRIQVTSAGGRVTLERVTPTRRSVREYAAQRDLVLLDTAAMVPFVTLASHAARSTPLFFLDVRRGTLSSGTLDYAPTAEISMAEVAVTGVPVTVTGLSTPLRWWRDARGRLLRVAWGGRSRLLRDDPPT
ncbi:MAG: hypothetical protein IT355_17925 [Gemmatimonadaceae bacterium]|nr:hypothetical protein [Gemmatimonadaceae bacterium]